MRLQPSLFQAILFSALLVPVCVPATASGQSDAESAVAEKHPLKQLVQIAAEREESIRETVQDYTCRIVKRELIHGKMQDHRFIDTKVRLPQNTNGQAKPLAVYMKFLGPKDVAGRTIVYVEGQNEGKMVVRRGGDRFDYVVTDVAPESALARKESLMDIRHMGAANMVSAIVEHLQEDMEADPTGENTVVEIFDDAKINKRLCRHFRITHPKPQDNLKFHVVNIYGDKELRLPVRVDAYGWPESEGKDPPLVGEFTYTKVKVNVGIADSEFHADRVRTARRD